MRSAPGPAAVEATCATCGPVLVRPGRETCPTCLADLVTDTGTVACPRCGRRCPARRHTCPSCLARLRSGDDGDPEAALVAAIVEGRRLRRPADRPPFAGGPSCTVLRLTPTSGLVLCGPEGFVEAGVAGPGPGLAARPPLTVAAADEVLFRLLPYEAADDALVAVGADGAPLATYLRTGSLLDRVVDVRDETSAPVARFAPAPGTAGFVLIETGGGVLATGSQRRVEDDDWIDDEWSVTTRPGKLPLRPLAVVALPLVAKVLFGLPEPVPVPRASQD